MIDIQQRRIAAPSADGIDYAALYDSHEDYEARRIDNSFAHAQIMLEVEHFKIPRLLALIGGDAVPTSALEIGCGTGELIGSFPVVGSGVRVGVDISPANVSTAQRRYPDVTFFAADFRNIELPRVDCVLLSDVLEHVEDDIGVLRDASRLGDRTLVNLPLEDNWLNRHRAYGPDDVSGHLRRYTLESGLHLFEAAGLAVKRFERLWIHETEVASMRRALRRERQGAAFSGPLPLRVAKAAAWRASTLARPLGRRLFESNLFVLAVRN